MAKAADMAKKTKAWPSNEAFIKAWQQANSLGDVAKALNTDAGACTAQASYLRRQGVPLKKFFSPGRPRVDYGALAALAKRYGGAKA